MATNLQPGDEVAVYLDDKRIRPAFLGTVEAVSPHGRLSVRKKSGRIVTVDRSVFDVHRVHRDEGGASVALS